MEKVLFTVLKATNKDIETIEIARQKNTGGFLSYFYSSTNTVPRPIQPRASELVHEMPNLGKNVSFNSDNAFASNRKNGGGSIPLKEFM